jgi:enamine deaminase RidA (YjgF/YER057c/UK114 family)
VVTGPATTFYIGAQGPLDAQGNLVGKGDIGAQADQALQNVQTALAAAGARLEHVIKWSIYLAQGQPLQPGIAAFQRADPTRPRTPSYTSLSWCQPTFS